MGEQKHIVIIGSGFAGLSAACVLAKEGFAVTILEKNAQTGGRARVWEHDGFKFDMGPSWYWMPDVFENFFAEFNKSPADYYHLNRLDPAYRIYFGGDDYIDVPAGKKELYELFDSIEPGSSKALDEFLRQAGYKYEVGMGQYVFKPSHSVTEYLSLDLLKSSRGLQLLTGMDKHVRKYFTNPKLIQLLEFPVLFLGASPDKIPAMYSLMNYADLVLGTWYPMGGMHEIVKAMTSLAEELGVKIIKNANASKILVSNGKAFAVETNAGVFNADMVVSGADYEHTDQHLLDEPYRNYSASYWDSRTMSPSSLLFYIGLNKRVEGIQHHNLFFDEDFNRHSDEIYKHPQWPQKPLFYVCCPSKTDDSVAPAGYENLFFLIPVAPDLEDTEAIRERYFNLLMDRFENITGQSIRNSIVVNRSYAINDFKADYNAFKGNAYGLANTLMQTAFLKPAMRNKKVQSLFYTGQLTVPGPGVPPAIISGQVVAGEVVKYFSLT